MLKKTLSNDSNKNKLNYSTISKKSNSYLTKNNNVDDHKSQILKDFKRVEEKSKREHFKYLGKLPFRSEIEEMEYKYLVAKMSN
jgi:DNA primase